MEDSYRLEWNRIIQVHERQLFQLVKENEAVRIDFESEFVQIETGLRCPAASVGEWAAWLTDGLVADASIRSFYQVTDGLQLPFFDAEANFIFRQRDIVRLDSDSRLMNSVAKAIDGIIENGDEQESSMAREIRGFVGDGIMMTPYADSGLYLLFPVAGRLGMLACSCLFEGSSRIYENFLSLVSNELERQVRNARTSISFAQSMRQQRSLREE